MAHVTLSPDYFRGELRIYGDWPTAFVRELLQNATDARPSRIDVRFEDVDGHGRVTFADDGHGMTREVLEDVFFALGKTTKTDANSIGGFGRARIFICFAQTRYTIRTGNLLVTGQGGEYTITETGEYRRGCEFVIDLIDENCDRVSRAFDRLLNTSALTVPVTIDGVEQALRPRPSRANRVLRDSDGIPWGRVYALEPGYGNLNVRVHGLTMFTRWLSNNENIVLELEPARARQVLSASRDSLVTEFSDQLDQFVSDLASNRRRALKPAVQPLDMHIGGGGFLVSDADGQDDDTESESGTGSAVIAGGRPADAGTVRVTPANTAAFVNLAQAALELDLYGLLEEPEEAPVPNLGFDVFMLADENDARVRKLSKAWNPAGWDERSGARRRTLLLTWKAAVGYTLDVCLRQHPHLGRVLWTVGWTFDLGVAAIHRGSGEGHVFALNPVTDDGGRRYTVSTRESRMKLLAIAAHEVCHVLTSDHDERFASLLTDLFGGLDPIAADRLMREAARA